MTASRQIVDAAWNIVGVGTFLEKVAQRSEELFEYFKAAATNRQRTT